MRLFELDPLHKKQKVISAFKKWACKKLGIQGKPKILYSRDKDKVDSHRTFGTTHPTGEIWVYVGNRNTADILRTLCHELVHYRQYERGTAQTNMDKEQHQKIEDEANALAGRLMREYGKEHIEIYEQKTGSLQFDVAAALPSTYAIPELQNSDAYMQYRFGVAMAGAKGAARRKQDGVKDFNRESPWGENAIVSSNDPNLETYIDDALRQIGLKGKKLISTEKSEEAQDVIKSSPVIGFKGYPR